MFPLKCLLVALYTLGTWATGYAKDCGDQQMYTGERCCDMCPPGQYRKEFCTEHKKTLCSPCNEGDFSNQYTFFDRCEKCQTCPYEYAEKCTPTRDAKCSCPPGFLCSNNDCSACEENKFVTGEKLNTTDISVDGKLTKHPECPDNAYFDAKEKSCKPWTQCSAFGLAELFPGNRTHNSICGVHAMHSNGGDAIHVILGVSFVLISLSLLVFLSTACIKNQANNNPNLAVPTNTDDFHLSKEESGLQIIIQDESKDSKSFGELYMGKVVHL
ncbi:tumor necrosis factor receptor superfamily member 18 isoform X2 [Trachinotus anak]|uniref:tumor necrosis factor receptor superfamily member 18 isoform X2 n=1 Tax=Trachinotus anak TaxID=443729 RepID=UPI0039F20C7A